MLSTARIERIPLSPLRYPGGKTRFIPHLREILHGRSFDAVVEPFCGGATVSLGMLEHGLADTAHITDGDPLVSAFWIATAWHTEALIEYMMDEPVTVCRWKYWDSVEPTSLIDRAMKALFKNRTTFSGLIHHGSVLGGIDQNARMQRGEKVKYPVGCRFNKTALANSIRRIGKWASEGRLTAGTCDYTSCRRTGSSELLYLDPPYVEKSSQLYRQMFTNECHRGVAEFANKRASEGSNVLISYDDEPLIRELYTEVGFHITSPKWSYGMGKNKSSRELLISTFEV